MYVADNIEELKQYKPAKLCTGKKWYIEYYIFNLEVKKMVRKKIMLNHIDKIADRRAFAINLLKKLNSELEKGWSPYVSEEVSKGYKYLKSVLDDFIKMNRKKYAEGDIRKSTILSYESYYKSFTKYIVDLQMEELFVFYFTKDFVVRYLDYVYNDLDRSSRTRDNYLKFIRLFSNYLVERSYLKVSPCTNINVLGKNKRGIKSRTIIPVNVMERISEYLLKNNKYFFLASQIIYFCMVRPKEMSYIKICHIDLEKSTIFIPGETAKNHKNAIVTIPFSLKAFIEEMGVMNYPAEYYLFSAGFKPGEIRAEEKQFARFWERHLRKDLELPMSLKFYSLKDTGITDMIRKYNDPIIARDQARHHDLTITNIYTPSDLMQANDRIKNDTGIF